ncbi:MAG TPA: sigma-70 family RNA polymerase sigma factor, partial [Planctomycetota bacterium]|nr:sigma-70 family RNA polymerase sigma factor [Planctomycetota bacterium]
MRRDAEPALDDVLAHADFVRGVARAVLGGDDRVEDVVQDTWLVAARQRPRRASALRAWLAVVARNLAYRVLRGSKRRALRERKAARTEGLPDAAEIAEREEVRSRLVAALLALEEPYRSALLLRYYEDLSVPEVALRLGVPLETARTRLRRGLDRLRERLGARRPDTRRSLAVLVVPSAIRSGPSSWPALLGVVAVKKALAVAVAVLLLVALGWTVLGPWLTREQAPETAPSQAAVLDPRDATPTLAAPAAPTVRAPAVAATPSATGRVVDGAGAPVAGARVFAWRDDVDVVVDPGAPAGGATSSTRTDASGTFRVPLEGKAPGFTLLATATGFAPAAVTGVQAGDDVTITLPESVSIHGTVRDLEERPIAGARVAWTGFVGGAKFTAETASGADGAYRLRGLTPGAFHALLRDSLDVSAEGYAPVRTSRAKAWANPSGAGASDGFTWDVWLGRGATIRGRVVDADSGAAVASARVVLWSEQEVAGLERPDGTALQNPAYYAAVGDVRTSEDGTFAIECVPAWGAHVPGTWIGSALQRRLGRLAAVADGFATTTQEVRVPTEGEVSEIEVRLTTAGTVRGRVLRPDAVPAAGATVGWEFASGSSWRWIPPVFAGLEIKPCVTDTNGRYLLVGVAARREAAEVVHVSGATPGASAWAP